MYYLLQFLIQENNWFVEFNLKSTMSSYNRFCFYGDKYLNLYDRIDIIMLLQFFYVVGINIFQFYSSHQKNIYLLEHKNNCYCN